MPAPAPAGHSSAAAAQPVFYYDLASPEAYLAAERVMSALPVAPEWQPVALAPPAFRCAQERDVAQGRIERRAAELGLQALRWPGEWPFDSGLAMRVAIYAKQIGRAVAFSLAAFRQAYAAGRDLSIADNVLIAAAACEMHPAAVLKAAELRSVREELARATAAAAALGVSAAPAILAGGELLAGERCVEDAADVLAAQARA